MSLPPIDSLHDAPIGWIRTEGKTLAIAIDGFAWSPGAEEAAPSVLRITGANRITANDVEVLRVEPELTDGEINRLEQTEHGVILHVFWHSYQPRTTRFVVYQFAGAVAELSAC